MKKILLLIFIAVVVLAVLIFSIPSLRVKILSKAGLGSGSGQAIYPAGENQPSSKTFSEPGLERIKAELLGRKIPGWNFDRITEFKKANISSIGRTGDRIDFQLDLQMLPYDAKEENFYDAQIIAIYLAGDDAWYLDRIEEVYLSFDIQVPAGRWITINPPPGCSLQPDQKNRLVWTSKTWDYEILSGPDIGEVTLPVADNYQVKARGKHNTRARITFRPVI